MFFDMIDYVYIIIFQFVENDKDKEGQLEGKLNNAFRRKMSLVETKREVEQKQKIKLEKQDAKEKGKKSKKGMKRSKSLAVIETKKAPRRLSERSFIDEERRLHEAYQLLLGEHHRRVKRRGSTPVSGLSTDRQQCQCLSKVTNECDGEGISEWSQSIFTWEIFV